MQFIEYYDIERWDGGESTNYLASFSTKEVAEEFLKKCGQPKHHHSGPYRRTVMIYDSYDDYTSNTREKIRLNAIAKLTPEEREVLKLA